MAAWQKCAPTFAGSLAAQAEQDKVYLERDKALQERDKRYDLMWMGVQKIADESQGSDQTGIDGQANYWAATTVHFLGIGFLAGWRISPIRRRC